MKKQLFNVIVAAFMVGFSVAVVSAGSSIKKFEVEIPFDFNVGEESYDAGSYVFQKVEENVLVFKNRETGSTGFVLGNVYVDASSKNVNIRLNFRREGSKRILIAVNSPTKILKAGTRRS